MLPLCLIKRRHTFFPIRLEKGFNVANLTDKTILCFQRYFFSKSTRSRLATIAALFSKSFHVSFYGFKFFVILLPSHAVVGPPKKILIVFFILFTGPQHLSSKRLVLFNGNKTVVHVAVFPVSTLHIVTSLTLAQPSCIYLWWI